MKRPSVAADTAFLMLALAGFALNLWLLARRFADPGAGLAGCGGGSCDELHGTRWALVFGVPVTLFGLLVNAGLMFSRTPHGRRLTAPLLGTLAGAAAWFVFVQAVLLRKICPWCMAAHGVGAALVLLAIAGAGSDRMALARRILVWAAAGFLGIGLSQVYGPVPQTHRIVSFDGGRRAFDVAATPRLGPSAADHVLVEYFDYQCAACRTMAGHLEALMARHPGRIAVLVMPVPLDAACHSMSGPAAAHPGSCAISRIALAVWRARPDAFPAFHRSLVAAPSEAEAGRLALTLMSPQHLAAAAADPWVSQSIRDNLAAWQEFSKTTDKLPKLLVRDRRILHGLPSGREDFVRVMERELGL